MVSRTHGTKLLSALAMLSLLAVLGSLGCDCDGQGIPNWVDGDMQVDPMDIPATGNLEAEVSVWVYERGTDNPLQGITITVHSSRNQGGNEIDIIEQSTSPTNADGRAVAFLGSTTAGEVQLEARQKGSKDQIAAPICEEWAGDSCATPLQRIVTFYVACPSGLENCDGECVDLDTDLEHCGACDNPCDLPHATEECIDGQCTLLACEDEAGYDWDNCDGVDANGCETDKLTDHDNCGSCGVVCADDEGCVDGGCVWVDPARCDQDGDLHYSDIPECGGDDCDDNDPNVHPGAPEVCGPKDDNCDGTIDEDPAATDSCNDNNCCTDDMCVRGQGCVNLANTDTTCCIDADPCTVNEHCQDGTCAWDTKDEDLDGHHPEECGGDDCDDNDPLVHGGLVEAGEKTSEICTDGKDNDCDGLTDLEEPTCNPCDTHEYCRDNDACNGIEMCINHVCQKGTAPDCDDGNVCTDDRCVSIDALNHQCNHPNNTAACSDGDPCTVGDVCSGGACTAGTGSLSCGDGNVCTDDVCVAGVGCQNTNNTAPCDDGNPCTTGDVCANGLCQAGSGALDCDDGEICTDDSCDPGQGCVHTNNTALCDDGDPCTIGDACLDGSCQPGAASLCDDHNVCTDDVCDPGTGGCTYTNNTASCDDGDVCTMNDVCANSQCRGVPTDADGDGYRPMTCGGFDCDDGDPNVPLVYEGPHDDPMCSDGVDNDCDGATDGADNGCVACTGDGDCTDNNVCNGDETCVGGRCVAGTPLDCDDSNPCTDDSCNTQTGCLNQANMDPCDDGDACTRTDRCDSGSCVGTNPVVCTALDQCHDVGVCDSGTGVCSNPPKTDGTPCDDNSLCTQTDTCQAGTCVGTDPVVCSPLDTCHNAGTCNPGTGICSNPQKADGAGCVDGDACTLTDTCQSGTCVGSSPVVCTPLDQCHNAGVCDPGTGVCSDPPKADNTPCDDNDACTQTDTCQAGACTGANPVICTAQDQCHDVGTCDPGTGVCSNPSKADDTPCDDGNACTQTDTCQMGICAGTDEVVCTALDQCHDAGVCNTTTGNCSNPQKSDGSPCDDGDACSTLDTCQGGNCTAGATNKDTDGDTYFDDNCTGGNDCDDDAAAVHPGATEDRVLLPASCSDTIDNDCDTFVDMLDSGCAVCINDGECDDSNDCTTDICSGGACENNPVGDGTGCDDGNACTQTDECQGGTCTGLNPVVCTAMDQCHNVGVCNTTTGNCSNPQKPDDSPCDDSDACTQTDTCQSGSCIGADPVICTALDQCHNAGSCIPSTGLCTNPPKTDGAPCDDNNACTQTDTCQGGVCTGSDAVVCTALDQCHNVGVCNTSTGVCSNPPKTDGTSCDDGNACTQTDTCQGGSCQGADPVVCTPLDQCHNAGTCNTSTGNCSNPQKADDTPCDDGNNCSSQDTCQDGTCTAGPTDKDTDGDTYLDGLCPGGNDCNDNRSDINPGAIEDKDTGATCSDTWDNDCDGDTDLDDTDCVDCTAHAQCADSNPCTTDLCVSGFCQNNPVTDGTPCDDNNACTQTDECQGGTCTGLNPVVCTASDQCHNVGTCDSGTGLCSDPPKADGTSCNDGNACTQTDECQGGVCTGSDSVICTALDQCHNVGVCNTTTGNCSNPPKTNGTPCDDNNACSQTDTCQGGTCTGSDWVVCSPLDQCHNAGTCNTTTGNCSNPPKTNGTPCDDENACTQTDTCQGGVCQGADSVVCTPLDQCHNAGTCNTTTGLCSNPNKPDDTPCDDENACTQTDTCQGGVCQGADPVICTALDQCHTAGTCNTTTGNCSNPNKPDDTPCNDGNPCSTLDTCQGGTCTAGATNKDTDGDTYFDELCPGGNDCDDDAPAVNPGVVEQSYGQPMCTDTIDNDCDDDTDIDDTGCMQCTGPGDCDDGNACTDNQCIAGECQNPPVTDGTSCDDNNACTQTDTCQGGLCTGADPVVCTASDQCHLVGTCNTTTGVCSDPPKTNGTPCDDSNACSQTDTCQSGNCTGSDWVVCTASDQCHLVGTCNTTTGVCSDPPKTDGTACDDSNACSQTDTCQDGACEGSNWVTCTALDQCHEVGVCNTTTGNCSNPPKTNGTACDDNDACTQTDECQSGNCVGSDPVVCTASDQCHLAGTCNTTTGVCSDPPKTDGSPCDDNDACTLTDTCQGGVCQGDDPVVCTASDQCHDAGVCDSGTGLCSDPPKTDGTPCDDGEDCSYDDQCTGGVCDGTDYSCDDFSPCTRDSCNGDNTCTHTQILNYWLEPGFEWVEETCDDNLDNDCDGCLDENCAGYAEPIVAAEVILYSSPDGLRRLSGNGQFGPVGKMLPSPLVVQVNNGADNPMKGEPVTFMVEPLTDGIDPEHPSEEGVCFGDNQTQYDCTDMTLGRLCPMDVMKVCNTTLGTLYDEDGNPGAQLDLHTDDNGQARVWLALPSDDTGMTVVSATANGDTVYFFAGTISELADSIDVPTLGDTYPTTNPAVGPLIQTKWSNDNQAPVYMGDFSSYTLAITGLSVDNSTCFNGELPEVGLTDGGTLYICGHGFASAGNQVWVGGVPATVTDHSTTKLTVTLPEGIPGAASVMVKDGSTTICKDEEGHGDSGADNFGYLESAAVAAANLWRKSPKPAYIYSRTGGADGSSVKVKLLGLDRCGNPLSLSGHTPTVDAYNPYTDIGSAASSSAVTVTGPDGAGIATVAANSTRDVRAAVIVGEITDLSLSSNDLVGGNATVSAVPRFAPGQFVDGGGTEHGNLNGINSMLIRGADETATTEVQHMNPGIRLWSDGAESVEVDTWTLPYGQTAFETEANIGGGTLTGEGMVSNLTTEHLSFYDAAAGTSLAVLSGGEAGMVMVFAATVGLDPSTSAQGTTEVLMGVPPVVVPGDLVSPETATGTQIINMVYDTILFFEDDDHGDGGYPRGLDVRLRIQRPLP